MERIGCWNAWMLICVPKKFRCYVWISLLFFPPGVSNPRLGRWTQGKGLKSRHLSTRAALGLFSVLPSTCKVYITHMACDHAHTWKTPRRGRGRWWANPGGLPWSWVDAWVTVWRFGKCLRRVFKVKPDLYPPLPKNTVMLGERGGYCFGCWQRLSCPDTPNQTPPPNLRTVGNTLKIKNYVLAINLAKNIKNRIWTKVLNGGKCLLNFWDPNVM